MTESRTRTPRDAGDGATSVPVARSNGGSTAHAQAAKVLTTGASVSMVFGIVAYMAHSTAVKDEAARLQELQAQQAAQAAQQGGAAPSTTLPGATPTMVVLPDGSVVAASTLVPGAVPTSALPAGSTSQSSGAATGGSANGGSTGGAVTTQPATSTPSGGGGAVTTAPATTNPPVTVAPTTTVVTTVAPTTTVSGGSGTSH